MGPRMSGARTHAHPRNVGPSSPRSAGPSRWDWASAALFAAVLATAALTFTEYGITWDERDLQTYGNRVIGHYASLLRGEWPPPSSEFRNLHYYGGLYAAAAAWVSGLGFPEYEARHALNALVGVAGVFGTWRLARLLGGPSAAFWAAFLLVLTPRWWGHMFNNPKDVPFAVATIWALYLLVRAARHLPRIPPHLSLSLGLAVGLASGIRVGGLVVMGYLGLAMAWFAASAPARRDHTALRAMGLSFVATLGVAWLVMLLSWPWAQSSPLLRPFEALALMSRFAWDLPVLFAGSAVPATELPRSYALHWLWISTPELVGVLLAMGLAGLAVARRRALAALAPEAPAGIGLVCLAAGFPIAWVMLIDADLYDALRQLLFVVPPICVLAGLGWAVTADALGRAPAMLRTAALAGLAVWLAFHVSVMVRLHPYESVYFNRTVGGLAGAHGRYETDYWGNSYREAALALRTRLVEEGNTARPPRVMLCTRNKATRPLLAGYYLPGVEMTKRAEEADFFIATTRWDCPDSLAGTEIFRVERFGVPLAIVKDVRDTRQDPGSGAP